MKEKKQRVDEAMCCGEEMEPRQGEAGGYRCRKCGKEIFEGPC